MILVRPSRPCARGAVEQLIVYLTLWWERRAVRSLVLKSLVRAGVLVCWCAGVLACWCAGVLVCWRAGVLVCWCAGVLACWRAGVLVCWCAGVLVCGALAVASAGDAVAVAGDALAAAGDAQIAHRTRNRKTAMMYALALGFILFISVRCRAGA